MASYEHAGSSNYDYDASLHIYFFTNFGNNIIVENEIAIMTSAPMGNSGTIVGGETTPENSESAKLFPFRFSNAIVIGPV
jgi:hypothetical protein